MLKGDFTENMGRVFIIYTGGCMLAAGALVLLSLAGVSNHLIGIGFVALTVSFYALMGLLARTRHAGEYYEAGRRVPALYTGMATAADWMSAASFLGLAGAIYAAGYDGLAFVLGFTGGYILVAVLLAPYLRKFGQFTVPDFLSARYGGKPARLMGVVILVSASFAYVVGQLYGTGIICARFLGIPFELAVFVGLGGILLCSMLGGMRALIWTQVAQYVVVIAAYLLPVILLSTKETGIPLPQIMTGEAMQSLTALQAQMGLTPDSFGISDRLNFFGVVICLMLGTASLPHVLSRFFNTPSVREARTSVAWSLLFICVLYVSAPAYAIFAKLEVVKHVLASGLTAGPEWLTEWSRIGLASLSDGHFFIDPDAIVLAAPEIAGLPFVVAGLVAAGALAASMSSADGLLMSIGNALSHDLYFRILKPTAEPKHRMALGKLLMVLAALLAAFVASHRPAGILTVVGWAFSLAASGLFPALVLGIWWKRTTNAAAVLGMASGWLVCLGYIIAVQALGMAPLFGVKTIAAGLFGLPVSLIVTLLVSLFTQAPSQEMQDFIDSIRIPRGQVKMVPKGE